MSDELDEFLRQAAERRRKRQQEKAGRPPIAPTAQPSGRSTPPPLPPPKPPVRTLSHTQDDVYERGNAAPPFTPTAGESKANSSEPYSTLSNPPEARRLQTQFDQPNSSLKPTVGNNLPGNNLPSRKKPLSDLQRSVGHSGPLSSPLAQSSTFAEPVAPKPPPIAGNFQGQPIAEQLRNPNALPIGTILVLGEILKRPWE